MSTAHLLPSSMHMSTNGPTTHEQWNTAIIDYFTRDVPLGSPVYLSVDERALLTIYRTRLGRPKSTLESALNQFWWVLRNWCGTNPRGGSERLTLPRTPTHDSAGRPTCVVFLAGMVLAAYYMEEDEDRSGQAYFPQLRDVLGVIEGNGRPPGLGHEDEVLWQRWNRWLERCGRQPTARRGDEGSWKYIEYPLSQCLLRRTDHQRLARLFREEQSHLDRSWDRDQFANHLPILTQSLGTIRLAGLLLDTSNPQRHEAIVDDAYEVFRSPWHETEDFDTFTVAPSGPRSLEAGLYRIEKDRRGNAEYYIYPRIPRSWQDASLSVEIDGKWRALKLERPGWLVPLPEPIRPGKRLWFNVKSSSDELERLILPDSPFWVFVQDPDGYTNDLATWPTPCQDGETFLLLAQDALKKPLEVLREQEFLRWQGEPVPTDFDEWREYHDCQVCRFDWESVPDLPGAEALIRKLRPAGGAIRLSLEGGLSVPGQNIWLEGFPPSICVRADASSVKLCVRNLSQNGTPVVQAVEIPTHVPQGLEIAATGDYYIEAQTPNANAPPRYVRVARWDQLELAPLLHPFDTSLGNLRLRGASILAPQEE